MKRDNVHLVFFIIKFTLCCTSASKKKKKMVFKNGLHAKFICNFEQNAIITRVKYKFWIFITFYYHLERISVILKKKKIK